MPKKSIGLVLLILGVVLAAVSLAADTIGIGPATGFGWKQLTGTAVGVVTAFAGAWIARTKKTG